MKVLDMDQGSNEWFNVRGLLPTASNFSKIYTSTGKDSTQASAYMNELLANWLIGDHPDKGQQDGFKSEWMDRGTEMEEEARACYEMEREVDVDQVGFCLSDHELCGCSPDGLIGLDGGLEIKCPKASTHVEYMLRQKLPATYVPQVQGSLLVTGRAWWDFYSYHPDLEPLRLRIYRNDTYLAGLENALVKFSASMLEKRQRLIELGYQHAA